MNQILVSEKLYITPELKRKKKAYKIKFIISICIIAILIIYYVYSAYARNKDENISQEILASIDDNSGEISVEDDVWVFIANADEDDTYSGDVNIDTTVVTKQNQQTGINNTYTAPNGKVYNIVGTIDISSLGVSYPILAETTDALLKVSVCKFWGCEPNEVGNLCIAGHNYRNNRFFSKVPNMKVGDTIDITDLSGRNIKYSVYDKFTVDPTDVSCTSQLTNRQKIVTLITCTNDSKQRVVVKAREV